MNDPKVANPTTDADREAGMLQGDPQLLSILSNLRSVGDDDHERRARAA